MYVSLKDIYDVLISEIGVLAIPRDDSYEIRTLTSIKYKNYSNIRDTSGTNIGTFRKANALFKKDIFFASGPAVKDLVEKGTVIANGGVQDVALDMLSLLTIGRLFDEMTYVNRVVEHSIIYKVALDVNIEGVNANTKELKDEDIFSLSDIIHKKYEKKYQTIKEDIIERLSLDFKNKIIKFGGESVSYAEKLNLVETITICIALSVCNLEIKAKKNEKEILENQEKVKKYIAEMQDNCDDYACNKVLKDYFIKLWNECSCLSIRDQNDERTQMEKYIYPHFVFNNQKQESPIVFKKINYCRRMIVAESGLGKSSYLDMLTSVAVFDDIGGDVEVDNRNRQKINELKQSMKLSVSIIPILIKAGQYYHRETVFGGLLGCIVGAPIEDEFDEWTDNLQYDDDRKLFILIDALDEVDYSERNYFLEELGRFCNIFRDVVILATCRPIEKSFLYSNQLFRGIEEWKLEPFDRDQMREYIRAKIKADTRGNNRDEDLLLDNIMDNKYLKSLAPNPYMLEKMLVYNYSTGNNYAYNTIKFLVTNLVSRRWDRLFEEFPQIDPKDFSLILAGVAYKMLCEGQEIVEKVNLVNEFMDVAEKAGLTNRFPEHMFRRIVNKMNNAAGLLIYENDGYKFQHPIFANYLSALWIYNLIKASVKNRLCDVGLIEELIPEMISSTEWADTITMLFSVIYEHEARNEYISIYVFRKLVCMGMGSEAPICKRLISEIFDNLSSRKIGNNNVIVLTEHRNCIDRFTKVAKEEI